MTTRQDNVVDEHVTVPVLPEDDQRNVVGDASKKSAYQRSMSSSKYKRIDKEKRQKVILICHLAVFFVAIGLCVASFSFPTLQKARMKGIGMWQWCLLIAALLCGPLLSQGIVKFLLLFIDRDFSVKENLIYYVVGLGESAWVVLWFSIILVAWLWVVDEPSYLGMPIQDTIKIKQMYGTTFHIITITLITFILGSFLWLLKDLVLMKAKSSFHIRRFFDRIKKALFHQYVIDQLRSRHSLSAVSYKKDFNLVASSSGYKKAFRKVGSCWRKEKRVVDLSSFEDISHENVSCWGMKILIEAIIESPNLSYKVRSDHEYKEIDGEKAAIEAADSIVSSVIPEGHEFPYIGRRELSTYFNDDKVDEVWHCLLEGAHDTQIGKQVFRKWMVKAYKYREALVRALDANKSVFHTFSRFVDVLLVFFIFALWLIMLRVETRKVIFLIASALVGSAFIFGDTCKKLLENVLFVFLVHPFDIGDCCVIDNTPVIIDGISILTTTVLTFDNEMKHYPNAVLSGQSISNYTRSPHMGDFVVLSLDISTTLATINKLKFDIKRYIEENPQYWFAEHLWEMELEDMSMIKITLRIQHTINYHEFIERKSRRTELVLKIKDILDNLKLTTSNDKVDNENK